MRFGSPWPREKRLYFEALGNFLRGAGGPIPERVPDPLTPFREASRGQQKKPISLRLDGWTIELTKMMAKQHEMPYQAILRIWIEEGLRRALQEGVQEEEPLQPDDSKAQPGE